jgi:hypothetical protein
MIKFTPNKSPLATKLVNSIMEEIARRKKAYQDIPIKIELRDYLDAIWIGQHRDIIKALEESPIGKMPVELELNDYLRELRDAAWDRPSAWSETRGILGIEEDNDDLDDEMHCPDQIAVCRDIGRSDEDLQQQYDYTKKELEYLDRVFKGNVPPMFLDGGWDT